MQLLKKCLPAFPVAVLLYLLTSCTPLIYLPKAVNAPLPDSAGFTSAGFYTGTDYLGVQAAFSPVNHLVLTGNYTHFNASYNNRQGWPNDITREQSAGFGAGYFKKYGTDGRMEITGGAIFGTREQTMYGITGFFSPYLDNDLFSTAYAKYYLQADFGHFRKHIDWVFSLRCTGTQFSDYLYQNYHYYRPLFSAQQYYTLMDSSTYTYHYPEVFLEPAVTLGVHLKMFRLFMQAGFSLALSGNLEDKTQSEFSSFFCSAGITVNLNPYRRKNPTAGLY